MTNHKAFLFFVSRLFYFHVLDKMPSHYCVSQVYSAPTPLIAHDIILLISVHKWVLESALKLQHGCNWIIIRADSRKKLEKMARSVSSTYTAPSPSHQVSSQFLQARENEGLVQCAAPIVGGLLSVCEPRACDYVEDSVVQSPPTHWKFPKIRIYVVCCRCAAFFFDLGADTKHTTTSWGRCLMCLRQLVDSSTQSLTRLGGTLRNI